MTFIRNGIVPRLPRANKALASYAGSKRFGTIVCPRCNGRMVPQDFFGREGYFSGWRCVNCGEIMDPIMYQNRGIGAAFPNMEEEP